jgi:hypothetical protein
MDLDLQELCLLPNQSLKEAISALRTKNPNEKVKVYVWRDTASNELLGDKPDGKLTTITLETLGEIIRKRKALVEELLAEQCANE